MANKFIFLLLITIFSYAGVEEKIKGKFIGQISSLITWSGTHNTKEFTIGFFGKSDISNEIKKIYSKKKIKKKSVKIITSNNLSDLKSSNVIFIAHASSSKLKKIIAFSKKHEILTISDSKGFIDKGGIVQLFTVSRKVKIKLNNTVAKQSNLKIKSILLNLAKDVI